MLIYAFLLIVLLRPSWGLLGFFTLVCAVLWAISGVMSLGMSSEGLLATAIIVVINTLIFYAIGALIVFLRLRFGKGGKGDDKKLDKEMEKIRAEIAARDNQRPQ